MSKADFIEGLKKLGYNPTELKQFVVFDYEIVTGSKKGKIIKMAFMVDDNFPLSSPSGPHINPRLLLIHPAKDLPHPNGAVHESNELGPEWEYLSRSYQRWNSTDKSVATYMRFIHSLFEEI